MKKTIIAILMLTCFCMAGTKPTHYFEGRWYHCVELSIVEPVKPKLQKCTTSKGVCADYDSKGNMIHSKNAGYEYWYDYDTKGNIIHKQSGNFDFWCEYDDRGNKIHEIMKSGNYKIEFWFEYDSKGNTIHMWDSDGYKWWTKWFYDDKINIKYQCDVDKNDNPYFGK